MQAPLAAGLLETFMSLGVSRLGGMSQEQRDRLASAVRLLLLWVAASDGNVDESELQVAYQQFPEVEGSLSREQLVAIIRDADAGSIEKAIRLVAAESRELRMAFLELAITMSMADNEFAPSENHMLRFYADALYLGFPMLEKRFRAIYGSAYPDPGDLSDPAWWESGGGSAGMKDLYYLLGIEPQAGEEEIRAALASKPALADCSGILLDPARRGEYDEVHHILKTIGLLRHRLGLDTGHSWFLDNCPDFAPRKAPPTGRTQPVQAAAGVQQAEERREAPPAAAPPKAEARSSRAMPLALGIIGLVAAALVIAWLIL